MEDDILKQVTELRMDAVMAYELLQYDMERMKRVASMANELYRQAYGKALNNIGCKCEGCQTKLEDTAQ